MKQFKKLLANGDKKTRDIIMEALGRLGSVLSPENKVTIASDVTELYSQAIEDFKNDRESNEELVLKLTEFTVSSLGKDFAPFLPIVLPVLLENAAAPVISFDRDDAMEAEGKINL
jgi:phenylpyruvate tautomerase PptA (4-oxalocrotonate tautomerase family)